MATAKKSASKAKAAKTTRTSKKTEQADSIKLILRRMKSTGWMSILESVLVAVLGALLVWKSREMTQLIFYVVGIFLIVRGVYKIINYFVMHGRYDFYNTDLLYGVLALVFGILIVALWEPLKDAIGLVAGVWMIYGALVRMNTAIKLHAAGSKAWFYVLLLSLALMALGIYVLITLSFGDTSGVTVLVGWMMIAAAVVGIVDDIIFMRNLDAIEKLEQ